MNMAIYLQVDRWRVAELALFGSVLRDDFRLDNDIDVMVSFLPDAHPTLFKCEVDLITCSGIENSRNPYRREEILSTTKVIYEQGHSVSV